MNAKKFVDELTNLGLSPSHAADMLVGLPSWFDFGKLLDLIKNNLPAAVQFLETILMFIPATSPFAAAMQALLALLKAIAPKPAS